MRYWSFVTDSGKPFIAQAANAAAAIKIARMYGHTTDPFEIGDPGLADVIRDPNNTSGQIITGTGANPALTAGLESEANRARARLLERPAFEYGLKAGGYDPTTSRGQLLDPLFSGARSAMSINDLVQGSTVSGYKPGSFEQFVQQNLAGGLGQKAQNVFTELGQTALKPWQKKALFEVDVESLKDTEQGRLRTDVSDLARAAAESQYGNFASDYLPSSATINRQFLRDNYDNIGAGNKTDFYQFAKKILGIN